MTKTNRLLSIAALACIVSATVPGGASAASVAEFEIEAGACGWGGECTWVDNNGETHNCESNGNVAVILGNDNHVNYCHEEHGNGTGSPPALPRLR